MQYNDAKELFNKYQSGTCTPEEKNIVENWIIFGDFSVPDLSEKELEEASKTISDRVLTSIAAKQTLWWPRIAVAASLLICLGLGIYFYKYKTVTQPTLVAVPNDIAPGGNKAILTLANGAKISITDAASGELVKEQGITISKTAEGQLVYKIIDTKVASGTSQTAYNTIETPRGGQHQIILPDGTKIWLNAESFVKFPETFVNVSERRVELSGEAYFEVAKDKTRPFIVRTNRQQIEVLGTHFNISSYADEQKSVTTLLEGSIRIAPISYEQRKSGLVLSNLSLIMLPGQQASSSRQDLKVSTADLDLVMDWKNGDFMFKKESLAGIMRKVARWYDVHVEYDKNVDLDQTFSGLVSRSKNISEVLKIMQSTGQLKFEIAGKKVTVMQ